MSRILITGGAGFIGSNLERELIKRGHDVYIMDRVRLFRDNYYRGDIFEYIRMKEIFKEVDPEVVYHFAGTISRKECEETPQLSIMCNQIGTLNICNLAQEYDARLIYSGSSEEYGTSFGECPVTEDTPLGISTSMYSLTKRGAGEIVEYYQRFKNMDAVILRFCMLYGDTEVPTEYRSAIARFINYALHDQPLTVHLNTSRGWCYIDDAVDAIATMSDFNKVKSGDLFNIGNADEIPTDVLARLIVKMCNSKSKINYIDVEPTVIPIKRMSYDRIYKAIGWKATTPLEVGLKSTIEYQRKFIK